MVETEMSVQSGLIVTSSNSSYTKIETKENYYIDPKDIKLGIYSKELDEENKNYSANQLLPISIEQNKKYFYKKLGNTYAFLGDIYGDPKIIIGPHWPLYLFVTSFFSTGVFLIYAHFGSFINIYLRIIGIFIYLVFLVSYTYTAIINPGYPKNDIDSITGEPRKKFYFCNICKLWANIEKKTTHCPDCNICIEGNDHHCPWTGKCIGSKNFKSFVIFVVSIFVLFAYLIFLVGSIDRSYITKNKKNDV